MAGAVASVTAVGVGVVVGAVVTWRATTRRRDRYWTAIDEQVRRANTDEGASAVEYGLLVAAVAAVLAGVTFALGGALKSTFGTVSTSIQSCSQDPSPCAASTGP